MIKSVKAPGMMTPLTEHGIDTLARISVHGAAGIPVCELNPLTVHQLEERGLLERERRNSYMWYPESGEDQERSFAIITWQGIMKLEELA